MIIEDVVCNVCNELKSKNDCTYYEVCLDGHDDFHICFYCLDEVYDKEKHEINCWYQIVDKGLTNGHKLKDRK